MLKTKGKKPEYTDDTLAAVRQMLAEGMSMRKIETLTGVGKSTVSRIKHGQRVCDKEPAPDVV